MRDFTRTAICIDDDGNRVIVRRVGLDNAGWNPAFVSAGVRRFTRKCNARVILAPPTNPDWNEQDERDLNATF